MPSGYIFDIKRYALHDGPGIRTTVFLLGCPLSCWWCHNPEGRFRRPMLVTNPALCLGCGMCKKVCPLDGQTVDDCLNCGKCADTCPSNARELIGRRITVSEALEVILKDIPFYDQSGGGVTFSGGEPLWQPSFLHELLTACKSKGVHTAVETSGYAPTDELMRIAQLTDLIIYDLKLLDNELHRKYIGVGNELILNNLRELANHQHSILLRVPVIPGVNTGEENLNLLAEFINSIAGAQRLELLPYHAIAQSKYQKLHLNYQLSHLQPPTKELMNQIANRLRAYNLQVEIGGI